MGSFVTFWSCRAFDFSFGSSVGLCWNCKNLFASRRPTLYISFSERVTGTSSKIPVWNFFLAASFCLRISSMRICSSSSSLRNRSSSSFLTRSASSRRRLFSSSLRAFASSSCLLISSSLRILSSSLARASASSLLLRSSSFLSNSRSSRSIRRRSSSWSLLRSSSSCLRRKWNWSWLNLLTSLDLTFTSYSSCSFPSRKPKSGWHSTTFSSITWTSSSSRTKESCKAGLGTLLVFGSDFVCKTGVSFLVCFCKKGLLSRTSLFTCPFFTLRSYSSSTNSSSFSRASSWSLSSLDVVSVTNTCWVFTISCLGLLSLAGSSFDSFINWTSRLGLILRISLVRTFASNSSSTESSSSCSLDSSASRSRLLCSSNLALSISSSSCCLRFSSILRHSGTPSSSLSSS